MASLIPRYSACVSPYTYYSCANGFSGCCSEEACNPGVPCPLSARQPAPTTQASSTSVSTASIPTTPVPTATLSSTLSVPEILNGFTVVATTSLLSLSSSSSTSTSHTSLASVPTASLMTISPMSSTIIQTVFISSGPGSVSTSSASALSTLSASSVNTTSPAERPALTTSSHSPLAAIVGSVVGGIAAIALALILIALCARRRRRKVNETRAATVQRQKTEKSAKTSENDDLFAPFGGFYREIKEPVPESGSDGSEPMAKPTGGRYHVVNLDEIEAAQLDGRPIYSPSEMPDTSTEASLRRTSANTSFVKSVQTGGQGSHIMSWNNYDAREAVSPPSDLSSSISPKDVSPESDRTSSRWTRLP